MKSIRVFCAFARRAVPVLGILLPLVGCDNSAKKLAESPATAAGATTPTTAPIEKEQPQLADAGSSGSDSSSEEAVFDTPDVGGLLETASVENGSSVAPVDAVPSLEPGQQVIANRADFHDRLFANVVQIDSDDPALLLKHLQEVDAGIKDLMQASANNTINEATFLTFGLELGRIKLNDGETLAKLATATPQEQKAGLMAKLEALSHMSGFRDVAAARELETFARELSASDDPDLVHQSRVVLMGFELQALQNGQTSDPNGVLLQAENLFQRPEDRSFPEMMTLMQASQVLQQMGFADAAKRVDQIMVEEYRDSPEPELRAEAWSLETRNSQSLANFVQAFRSVGTEAFDPSAVVAAARGLLEEFPSGQTLEQLAATITNVEYSGNVGLSSQLVQIVEQGLEKLDNPELAERLAPLILGHQKRVRIVGQELPLSGLETFAGQPLNMDEYRGKVVLIDFWATWCVPCLQEIPNIQTTYADLSDQGFDVISVNMDDNLAQAKNFLAKRSFPWKTYRATDPERPGFKSEFAQELGVSAIPFMVLLDRSGRVAAIHVRGEKLTPTVKSLLGE